MITAVVQARLSSSRLPGKVLKSIMGHPMLFLQLERISLAKKIDQVIVATSNQADDDQLAAMCVAQNIKCFRGDLNNVLDRFFRAAMTCNPDHVVRLTGDCPLIDPTVIDEVIQLHLTGDYDYSSNVHPPTFPDGLDTEVMKFSALHEAWEKATTKPEIEHVTQYFVRHPEFFKIGNYTSPQDFSSLRWTVDEPEDFTLISRIYDALYPTKPRFDYYDILALLQMHPEWLALNNKFIRNEGLLLSLAAESKIHREQKI